MDLVETIDEYLESLPDSADGSDTVANIAEGTGASVQSVIAAVKTELLQPDDYRRLNAAGGDIDADTMVSLNTGGRQYAAPEVSGGQRPAPAAEGGRHGRHEA